MPPKLENFLPITATIAITIFVAKEIIEYFKRKKNDKNKLNAIKNFLGQEIHQLSYDIRNSSFILSNYIDTFRNFKNLSYEIVTLKNDKYQFRVADETSEHFSSSTFPTFSNIWYEKTALLIAELDFKLFQEIQKFYNDTLDFKHKQELIIETLTHNSPTFNEEQIIEYFEMTSEENKEYLDAAYKIYNRVTGEKIIWPSKGKSNK
ncbi:hypothetical protein ND861_18880 [Leptospira sp. 2 VSF19]|uniref:Phage protein n=1 Tax=Leptospira soteropolitanensis TaxID=2950025 RepID=A0AAW5VUA1_9LEPT|nr:hypothetical protein [Leptospira soteropolitanensis]MCW7494731.1 hypothetical protein [Leptospira soteropolitanensis]MCW7502330.1 hypothetical protein [Leptospira soteropolitanensis]MCW7524563.1 hypothetical protein [Leptospira soteropolitanensis]MCW7528430.1 hypothetical protein [Leptospira soteropolitanensis]MCW7532294.1 hypothetical protein [Leptospira soteropolitanensis]